MLEIRLLGGFELVLTDHSMPGRLGPKSKGLLAFLAMSRGGAVSRGRLAGLLWGERDEERARHSLCQALTTVRAMLGPAATVLQTCPDGVRLAREGLTLDVDAFERAARSRQQATLQEVCQLYRGAFLEGLEIREPGFEEWMLSERCRLGELAADAIARLLDLQIATGDADTAIATARRLVAMAPLDEPAHARLIELYARLGRRGLAEAHYARCSELLRRELGQAPGDELEAALAKARRRAPGRSVCATPRPPRPAPDGQDRPQRARRWMSWGTGTRWATSATAAAMALLIGAFAWSFHPKIVRDGGHETSVGDMGDAGSYQAVPWQLPAERSIAVMPFENLSGDPEQASFADGIASDIVTGLSKFPTLLVAANASLPYRGRAVKVQDVARDLGVRYVLEGSVQSSDGRLRIHANLVDAATGRHVWAERYERPAENLVAMQKEIAQSILGMIGPGWGERQRAEVERVGRMTKATTFTCLEWRTTTATPEKVMRWHARCPRRQSRQIQTVRARRSAVRSV